MPRSIAARIALSLSLLLALACAQAATPGAPATTVNPLDRQVGQRLDARLDEVPELGKVDVRRVWRGTTIRVRFDSREHIAGSPVRLVVNGNEFEGNTLRDPRPGESGTVDIEAAWDARVRRGQGAGLGKAH